jgi:hypothetical protein
VERDTKRGGSVKKRRQKLCREVSLFVPFVYFICIAYIFSYAK